MLEAMKYFKETELKYRYPIELDLESSAAKGDPALNMREKLLRQAILHFDAAISLDPNYAPAFLNKANAFALLGDLTRARFYANIEARQASKTGNYPKVDQDIDVLMGIIEARSNNVKGAQALFTKADKAGNALAKINLRVLLKQPPLKEIPPGTLWLEAEKIENLTLEELSNNLRVDPKKTVNIKSQLEFLQTPSLGSGSKAFVNLMRNDEKTIFHLTTSTYTGKTARKIGVGDTRANIVLAYGEPNRSLETPLGQLMVYKNILFIIGKEGKLERWANYK